MSAELKALCELQTIDLALAKAQKQKASLDDGTSRKLLVEDARQKGKLEERLLELYDIVESRKSDIANAQASLKQWEANLAEHLEKIRQETATLTARIQELSKAREAALPGVDPMLVKRYESMRQRSGGVVVSKVEAENCSACHTQIITGLMRELQADKTISTCENCGRLLYLEH